MRWRRSILRWAATGAALLWSGGTTRADLVVGTGSAGALSALYDTFNGVYTPLHCVVTKPGLGEIDRKVTQRVVVEVDADSSDLAHRTAIEIDVKLLGSGLQDVHTTLEVSWDPSPAAGRTYTGTAVYEIQGAYAAELTIAGVSTTLFNEPTGVSVRLECEADRVQELAGPTSTVKMKQAAPGEDLHVAWSAVDGAVAYDVELMWVSDDDGTGGPVDPADLFVADALGPDVAPATTAFGAPSQFRFDATRITTAQTWLDVPDLYPRGYVLARVRPVGVGGPDWDTPTTGPWEPALPAKWTTVKSYPAQLQVAGHEDDLNWQWTASFAEEARRKDVVAYLDGALYTRQTVSRVNSDDDVVVGETLYDHAGRPAIQALPVPTDLSKRIRYLPDFTVSDATGKGYELADFDLDDGTCDAAAEPMSETAGAARYYSPSTPSFANKPWQAYVPRADGFPFTEVEYTPDNTGRVRRQSGVGPDHRLGSGHESRLFYSTALASQLEPLYGADAPVADRVKRNLARDANGQMSATYLDPSGKVVMTSLLGPAPTSLDALPYAVEETVTVDLAAVNNDLDAAGLVRTLSYPLVLASESEVAVAYAHPGQSYTATCDGGGACFECVYDVEVSLSDECGAELLDGGAWEASFGGSSADCDDPDGVTAGKTTASVLPVGTYNLRKTLTLDVEKMEAYAEAWVNDAACALTVEDLKDNLAGTVDASCNYDCAACTADLEAFDSTYADLLASDPAAYDASFDALDAACTVLCDPGPDVCDGLRLAMLGDLTPGGQYGAYQVNGVVDYTADPLSIFHPMSRLLALDINGAPVLIDWAQIASDHGVVYLGSALDAVIANWDEGIAEDLLKYHPEHCTYAWTCVDGSVDASADFDATLNAADLKEAQLKGWLDASVLLDQDPWFDHPGSSKAGVQDTLDHYQVIGTTTYTAAALAWGIVECPNSLPTCVADFITNNGAQPTPADFTTEAEWSTWRSLYQSIKSKQLSDGQRAAAMLGGCFNGCVGNAGYDRTDFAYCSAAPACATLDANTGAVTSVTISVNPLLTDLCCGAQETCWIGSESLYADRVPRFPSVQHLAGLPDPENLDAAAGEAQLAYATAAMWDLCHTCPDAEALRGLLSGLTRDGELVTLPTVVSTRPEWPALGGALGTGEVTWSGGAIGSSLDGRFVQQLPGGNEAACELHLRFAPNAPASATWDAVESFGTLTTLDKPVQLAPSTWNFQSVAHFDGSTDVPVEGSTNCPLTDCLVDGPDENGDGLVDWVDPTDPCLDPPTSLVLNGDFESGQGWASSPDLAFTTGCPGDGEWTVSEGPGSSGCNAQPATTCPPAYADHTTQTLGGRYLLTGANATRAETVLWQGSAYAQPDVFYRFEAWVADVNIQGSPYGNIPEIWLRADGTDLVGLDLDEDPGFWRKLVGYFQLPAASSTATPVALQIVAFFPNAGTPTDTGSYADILPTAAIGVDDVAVVDASCDPSVLCDAQPVELPFVDTCEASAAALLEHNAQAAYDAWVDAEKQAFREAYAEACMAAVESIDVTYKEAEYHRTLYSYDVAGNLTHTVPPGGVEYGAPTDHRMRTDYAYGSLDQVRWQDTPDGGLTCYWYNDVGQLRFSQNAEQVADARYSYMVYDDLGRAVEVGEVTLPGHPWSEDELIGDTTCERERFTADEVNLPALPAGSRAWVTRTFYDGDTTILDGTPKSVTDALFDGRLRNLRGRVAGTTTERADDGDAQTYDSASWYSYDVHGNVDRLVQDMPALAPQGERFKGVAYTYDLLGGTVRQVDYQPGEADQFHHRYRYDADNRITRVETSPDGVLWDRDARYRYYAHGPLARTVLGDQEVQGLDNIYTIQGWIKAVNSQTLVAERDPGRDGLGNGVAPDVFGYTLSYFPGDYQAAKAAPSFAAKVDGPAKAALGDPLYNGNITAWVMSEGHFGAGTLSDFHYDALNRLLKARTFTSDDVVATNSWATATDGGGSREILTYDPNGNIQTLDRTGPDGSAMDALRYRYKVANPTAAAWERDPLDNRLYHVRDDPTLDPAFEEDLDDQGSACDPKVSTADCNYAYSEIGNLTRDVSEDIEEIAWTPHGKVAAVRRVAGSDKPDLEFAYDPGGNRLMKRVLPVDGEPVETWYVRDATGNVLAVYDRAEEQTCEPESLAHATVTVPFKKPMGSTVNGPPGVAVLVDGVDPAGVVVFWQESAPSTAAALAAAINGYASSPDYTASAAGAKVTITAAPGSGAVGFAVVNAATDGSWDPIAVAETTLAGGVEECSDAVAMKLAEHHMYGASRLGMRRAEKRDGIARVVGERTYELANHLGNVLATVSDRRVAGEADQVGAWEYYPFGMGVPGRGWSAGAYRFGFNGMEDELGMAAEFSAQARQYQSRTSRWSSVDPLATRFPALSPYANNDGNPVMNTDPSGQCPWCVVWVAVEVGLAIYDAYDAYSTLTDENSSNVDKGVVLGGIFVSGILPGGGYGTVTKQTVKQTEKFVAKEGLQKLEKEVVENSADLLKHKPYTKPGGGHHVPAKSAVKDLDPNKLLAIPNDELAKYSINHNKVTGAQKSLYMEHAKTNKALTWDAVKKIETEALLKGSDGTLSFEKASKTVDKMVDALQEAYGLDAPTHFPWNPSK